MRMLGCIVVVSILLSAGASSGCKKKAPPPAPVAEAKVEEKKPEPPPVKKVEKKDNAPKENAPEDKSFIFNQFMQGQRAVRMTDMRTLGQLYNGMMPPPLTVDAFMDEVKKTAPLIAKKITDREYVVNLQGKKLRGDDILAYERQSSAPAGFAVAKANGEVVEFMPLNELKKALGID
jgi:hypothetical protein